MSLYLYESSAGSGKTYTLVKAYLAYILKRPEAFRHVLAVTFTNKAAGEMKERIIAALKILSMGEGGALKLALQKETDLSEEHLKKQSRQALRLILHSYSDFAVMTIDSFIYKVVRSFAVELGLPLLFDVDLDENRLISLMADEFIDSLEPGEAQAEMLVDYIIDRIDLRDSWKYDKDLIQVARELIKERAVDKLESLAGIPPEEFKRYRDEFKKRVEIFRQGVNKRAGEILESLKKAGLHTNDFAHKDKGICNSLKKLATGNKPDDFNLKEHYSRFLNRQWFSKDTLVKRPDILTRFQSTRAGEMTDELQAYIEKEYTAYVTAYSILNTLPLVALLSEIEKRLMRYKTENNLIPISDFAKRVAEVVKSEPVPFIYWKVGEKFDHYLIDEFQDTSRIQWSNLFPLIENSMAGGRDNLCVGDPKQSIYRWRGGDPDIIQELPALFGRTAEVKTRRLKGNWRSAPEIVRFNNSFFSFDGKVSPFDAFGVPPFYSPEHVEQAPEKDFPGYVCIRSLAVDNDFRTRALEETLQVIHRLFQKGIPLSDMTVLVRTNREGARVADFFFRKGVDVLSPDSLMLNNDRRIRFLISLFYYLETGEELYFREAAFFFDAYQKDNTENLRQRLSGLKTKLHPLSLYEKAETCIEEFGLHHSGGSFLTGFLEVIHGFSQTMGEGEGVTTFLEWWEENKENEKCALKSIHGRNALQVMTIHKAKGLEFPFVFIPFADWEMVSFSGFRSDTLWVDDANTGLPLPLGFRKYLKQSFFSEQFDEEVQKNYEDNLNILYVAFTRASRALYVLFPDKEPSDDDESVKKIHFFIKERLSYLFPGEFSPCSEGGFLLQRGEEPSDAGEKEKDLPGEVPYGFTSTSWQKRLHIKRVSPDDWSLLGDENKALRQGVAVHHCLEKARNTDDVYSELKALRERGILSGEEEKHLLSNIEKIMGLPAGDGYVKDFFSGDYPALNEGVLLTASGDYRPDRLLFTPAGVLVIDYKTGTPRGEDSAQIRHYLQILRDAGYDASEGYLLYLNKGTIERVQ